MIVNRGGVTGTVKINASFGMTPETQFGGVQAQWPDVMLPG